MKTLHLMLLLALAGLAYASNKMEDTKQADIERDILKALETELDALEREPRAVRINRIVKYFMYLMKKASPKLRKRIMEAVRHPPKTNGKYPPHRPIKAKSSKLIASRENSGWGWTVFDALDSFGVFDYFLGGADYDDAPAPKAKANPPPRKSKKSSSSASRSANRAHK